MKLAMHQINDIKNNQSLDQNNLGHAVSIFLGNTQTIAYSLFSLLANRSFWVSYSGNQIIEKYTVVHGEIEVQYQGEVFILREGDTLDASHYPELISFYSEEPVEILMEMSTAEFEQNFRKTELVQRDAAAIERVDGYTYHHCTRIKDYSIELWKKLGQPIERISIIRWGAYFHDIGKLAVPIEILNKIGNLTVEEWKSMKAHTTLGARMMRNHEVEWLRNAAFIVEEHHERFDGKGYPYGLKGHEISLEAAIVAVVDSFDAMTTNRVYRNALSIDEAVQEIVQGRGTQFNPVVVDAFLNLLHDQQFNWK